jgi:hypothetical protein
MSQRWLVHLLGLCSVAAGALLASVPALVLPLDGLHSPAGLLLTRSLAVVVAAVGIGAWSMPPEAVRAYLWVFGVGVKGVGGLLWGATAMSTGLAMLAVGAVLDLVVALAIASGLSRRG